MVERVGGVWWKVVGRNGKRRESSTIAQHYDRVMDDRRGDVQDSVTFDGLRMSADEYLRLPDDGHWYELIDGVVLMSPKPRFVHQELLGLLIAQFVRHIEKNPDAGRVAVEVDVRFAPDLVYSPDLVFVASERAGQIEEVLDFEIGRAHV